jgi:hypothetical protein
MGDLHSGHKVGLTPPKFWGGSDPQSSLRATLWKEFAAKIQEIQPIDTVIVNGDCIDGRGERSGSTELITVSQIEQTRIAAEAINFVGAKNVLITRGTPYHTGKDEDYEDLVGDLTNAVTVSDQVWPSINGVVLDCKHHISGSGIPHGRATAIGKARLWNIVHNAFAESQPKADVIVRSHVHYYQHIDGGDWMGFVLPALQGLGSKYGSKICEGLVHFGFVWLDIEDRESWIREPKWNRWILTGGPQKKSALIL